MEGMGAEGQGQEERKPEGKEQEERKPEGKEHFSQAGRRAVQALIPAVRARAEKTRAAAGETTAIRKAPISRTMEKLEAAAFGWADMIFLHWAVQRTPWMCCAKGVRQKWWSI